MSDQQTSSKDATARKGVSAAVLELCKYPVIAATVLLSMLLLKLMFGIDFGNVTGIKTPMAEVQFGEEQTAAFTDMTMRLQVLEQAVLEFRGAPSSSKPVGRAGVTIEAPAASLDTQSVSAQTAVLTNLPTSRKETTAARAEGYIFIGNETGGRKSSMLIGNADDGAALTTPLAQLSEGSEYKALANIVLRKVMPKDDEAYYRASDPLGTIPQGTRIRLKSAPQPVDREFAVQYWAQVEVL